MVKGCNGVMGGSRFEFQYEPKKRKKKKTFTYQEKRKEFHGSLTIRYVKSWMLSMNWLMIRSHIDSTQECGVVLKLDGFSHLIG